MTCLFDIKLDIASIDIEIAACEDRIIKLKARREELCKELIDAATDIMMERSKSGEQDEHCLHECHA